MVTGSHRTSCFLALCSTPSVAHALLLLPRRSSSSRYFCTETVIPPLQRAESLAPARPPSLHSRSWDTELPVTYTNDPKQVNSWLADHVPAPGCALGFDVESVPDVPWRKPAYQGPAVVQLATPESSLVVHLVKKSGRRSRGAAPTLQAVLRDERIVKAGASIDDDLLELCSVWGSFEARSRLDLSLLASPQVGLKTLTDKVLGVKLLKSRRQAMSDWSQVPLSDSQIAYAARDAWAGAAVCAELAMREPDLFDAPSLIEMLRTERSLKDLYRRQRRRNRAKYWLSAVVTPQRSERPLPRGKAELARHLQRVIRASIHERKELFDTASLGFQFWNRPSNSTVTV